MLLVQHCAGCCTVKYPSTGQGSPITDSQPRGWPGAAANWTHTGSKGAMPLPWPRWQPVVHPRDRVALGQAEVTVSRKARASSGARLPQGPARMSPFSHTGLARGCPSCPSSSSDGPTEARLCQDTGWVTGRGCHRSVTAVSLHAPCRAGHSRAPAASSCLPLQEQNTQTPTPAPSTSRPHLTPHLVTSPSQASEGF